MAASATFALKAGVWFRRARRCIVSPDSQATACPLSSRNSTYRPVQISEAGSSQSEVLYQMLQVAASKELVVRMTGSSMAIRKIKNIFIWLLHLKEHHTHIRLA